MSTDLDLSAINKHFGLEGSSESSSQKNRPEEARVVETQTLKPKKKRKKKKAKKKCMGCTEVYIVLETTVEYYSLPSEFRGILEMPMPKLNGEPQPTLKDGNEIYELVDGDFRLKIFASLEYELQVGNPYRLHKFRVKNGTLRSGLLKNIEE
jgi:hypothetical protein